MNTRTRASFSLALLAATTLIVAGCNKKPAAETKTPPASVDVQTVATGTIEQQVSVTGNLDSLDKSSLSSKTTGIVVYVGVREGDTVKLGQVVARLDPTELQAQVAQYQAALENAQVKVIQAQTQYTQSITNAEVAVNTAKSQVEASQVSLQKTITGQQSQEKQQVRDQVLQQQANYENAKRDYARQQQLYSQGAIAKSDLDNSETQFNVQKALLDNYNQALSLALQGGRPEDIASAQQTLRQSQLSLSNAIANESNVKVNRDDIVAAQATVNQTKAQIAQYNKQLADLNITSPIDGIVTARSVDPGQTVAPGTDLVDVADLHSTYYQPTVSETDFRHISVGQAVSVSVDAYPGNNYKGHVVAVFPTASTTNRQFSIRVTVDNPNAEIRPGMFARGEITTEKHSGVVVVPLTALIARDQTATVDSGSYGLATGGVGMPPQRAIIVGPGDKAVSRNVEVGIVGAQNVEVLSGLSAGVKLIVKGQATLSDGDAVSVSDDGRATADVTGSAGQ